MAKSSTKTANKRAKAKPAKAARPSAVAGDDTAVTALDLPAAPLTPHMAAYFLKCEEKLGFVPNVLKAYAFDMAKLEAFVAMYNDLMLAPSGLSKLEREMIAVAVSAHNRCYYCLVAHGAAVRQLSGDPPLGELMAMNYRAARLSKREQAMLDFAVKLTAEPWLIERRRPRGPAPHRLQRPRYLGHRCRRRLFQHVEPRGVGDRHAAQQRLSPAGALIFFCPEQNKIAYRCTDRSLIVGFSPDSGLSGSQP